MKNKSFFSGVLITLLIVLVFNAGKAYAAGCFTDYNTAAACWLKDNGVVTPFGDGSYRPTEFLRRSDAANYLFRINKVPPRVGDFHFSQALSSIRPNGNFPNGIVEYYSSAVMLRASAVGVQYYQAHFTLPTNMYGRAVYLKGAQICYGSNFGDATIKRVELSQYYVDAIGVVGVVDKIVDTISRTDSTCRVYSLAAPSKLAGDNQVVVIFAVDFTSTGNVTGKVAINSITAILSPSQETGALDMMDFFGDALMPDPTTASDSGE